MGAPIVGCGPKGPGLSAPATRTGRTTDRGKAVDRSRLFRILGIAGGIVLLALVIFGVAAISTPRGGVTDIPIIKSLLGGGAQPPVTQPPAQPLPGTQPGTTTASQGGGSSGGLATSTDNAGSSSGGGTSNNGGGSSGTNGGGTANGGGGSNNPPSKPITFAPMAQQLPTSIPGYSFYRPYTTKTESIVTLDPTGPDRATVTRVQLTVYDRGSAAAAQQFVNGVSKRVYPKDVSTFPVTGVAGVTGVSGYFGTDGSLLATAVWTVDRFVYEVGLTSSNNQPAQLRPIGQKIAVTFRPTGR